MSAPLDQRRASIAELKATKAMPALGCVRGKNSCKAVRRHIVIAPEEARRSLGPPKLSEAHHTAKESGLPGNQDGFRPRPWESGSP